MAYIRDYPPPPPTGALGVTLKLQRTALTHLSVPPRPRDQSGKYKKTAAWDLRSGTRGSSGKFTIIRLPVLFLFLYLPQLSEVI